MKRLLLSIALGASAPTAVFAQTVPAPTAPSAAVPASADPAREAAAQRVVARLLPPGIYRRVMRDMFPAMMDAMMGSIGGLGGPDMGISGESGKTLEQLAAERDPAFRERMSIMVRIMGEELAPVMDKIEPGVRAALGRSFAQRFTRVQLTDLDTFLATPSGTAFGAEFMLTFMDPGMMREMGAMMPEMMKIMPKMMERFQKETAHLPPEPKRGDADGTAARDRDPA